MYGKGTVVTESPAVFFSTLGSDMPACSLFLSEMVVTPCSNPPTSQPFCIKSFLTDTVDVLLDTCLMPLLSSIELNVKALESAAAVVFAPSLIAWGLLGIEQCRTSRFC